MNGRNPMVNWCITVSSLTAALAATLALGTSHGFWQRVLFFVALSTTLPALGYFLLIGAYHSNRWMKQRLPTLPWRRVHWSIPNAM
jgi:hypothetical protein